LFTKKNDEKNEDLSFSGVSYSQSNLNVENNTMNLEQEINDLKQKIEAMQNAPELVKEAYSAASALKEKTIELENTIKANEVALAEVKASLDAVTLEKEEAAKKMDEDMKKKEEEMKKVKSELDAANEVIAGYKMQEEEMKKKEKKMARKAALLDKGIETEVAEATVEKFEELSDDAFDAVTSLWAAKMPPWMNKDKEGKKKDKMKASESTDPVDETVLENVDEPQGVDLGVGETEENSSEDTTRAALIEFVYNRLGKQLNKGE
jgi:chromosome segregation ATPase